LSFDSNFIRPFCGAFIIHSPFRDQLLTERHKKWWTRIFSKVDFTLDQLGGINWISSFTPVCFHFIFLTFFLLLSIALGY
jgi:hypothetical protein